MSLERWWRPCIPLLIACLALSTLAVGPTEAGYQASVYSNESAFRPPCVGFTDSLPAKMLAAAKSAYARLGYTTGAYTTTSFTRSSVLSRTVNDWGFYVHSHGDYYWHSGDQRRYSGFREDGGDCSQAVVYSKDIAAKRAGRPTNLVVISTCYNGDSYTTLPAAFGIAKTKVAWNGPVFFLGYLGEAYDNDEWTFEQRFWDALAKGRHAGQAFDIAGLGSFTHASFGADWWGSYDSFGLAGPYDPPCTACQ